MCRCLGPNLEGGDYRDFVDIQNSGMNKYLCLYLVVSGGHPVLLMCRDPVRTQKSTN